MIKIHSLTKKFRSLIAVNCISLDIPTGSVFGLLGTNGAGKSTLLRMLAGILQPDNGTISIDNQAVWDNEITKANCFYLSDKHYYFPNATAESMGRFYQKLYPKFEYERYLDLLETFHLESTLKLRTFSKGMQKQVGILAAICSNTAYIFCDEVFDGLDPVIRQSITNLIHSELAKRTLTIVAASHNLRELEHFCSRIGILHKGGILLSKDVHSMQYQTHKIQCILTEEQCAAISLHSDIVSLHKEGFLTTFLMHGNKEDILQLMKQLQPEKYEFLPLTLEEIFINETEVIGYDIKLLFS